MSKPNIILFMTDQQRFDTICALGYPWMITPNLDRIVNEGTSFTQCYCASPSCVPSRASFFNGMWPHTLGVYNNGTKWQTSWVDLLNKAGYHCVNIGKMHTMPFEANCGFDQRFIVENKDRPRGEYQLHGFYYDEWDKFLSNCGQRKPSRETYRNEHPQYETALGAFEWPLEAKYHSDVFVGNMAKWFIKERQSKLPLFLQIGFPGPHPPYDPPKEYVKLYDEVDIPLTQVTEQELALQHKVQAIYRQEMIAGNHDAIKWTDSPMREQLLRLRKYYAANVTLIDKQIGEILKLLEEYGYLEDAIVIFTSDHGDCLGDHGLIQKWTMYDCIVRIPMIIWAPDQMPKGYKVEALYQQMDIAATLLEMIGLTVPEQWDAKSTFGDIDKGREAIFAEHASDNVMYGTKFMTMIRTSEYKLVHYIDHEEGELFDLINDPGETSNLWKCNQYDDVKNELIKTLLNWRISQSLKKS